MATNKRGQKFDDLFLLVQGLVADLAELKAKYEDHRHSVAGAASTGTKPSTQGATAAATASVLNFTTTSDS